MALPPWLTRLLEGKNGAKESAQAEPETDPLVPDEEEATPAGTAARLEARNENLAEHAYPAYRLLVALVLLLTAAVLGLSATITAMMPLKTIEPMFLQVVGAGERAFAIEPLRGSSYRRADAIFENIAKTYVTRRHEVIEIPYWMEQRWGSEHDYIGSHSSSQIWETFKRDAGPLLEEMRETPYRRTVKVESVTRRRIAGWNYLVVFETTDSLGAHQHSEVLARRFEARIELRQGNYGARPNVDFARLNPFGIFVTGYDVRPFETPG